MSEHMTREQATAIVYDCYKTGQTPATAAELTGYSRSWVGAEFRRLRARGISPVVGQLELFDTSG